MRVFEPDDSMPLEAEISAAIETLVGTAGMYQYLTSVSVLLL